MFHNKTYGGDEDCFLQGFDTNDNKTIISLLHIWCCAFFFFFLVHPTIFRIYPIILSLQRIFHFTVPIASIFKGIFSNHCYKYGTVTVLTKLGSHLCGRTSIESSCALGRSPGGSLPGLQLQTCCFKTLETIVFSKTTKFPKQGLWLIVPSLFMVALNHTVPW